MPQKHPKEASKTPQVFIEMDKDALKYPSDAPSLPSFHRDAKDAPSFHIDVQRCPKTPK